jgi:hypothetical protein
MATVRNVCFVKISDKALYLDVLNLYGDSL